jgi:hypothetical protein
MPLARLAMGVMIRFIIAAHHFRTNIEYPRREKRRPNLAQRGVHVLGIPPLYWHCVSVLKKSIASTVKKCPIRAVKYWHLIF